jgi:hypothetical protein
MEPLEIVKTDDGIHIDGFPDAVKVMQLTGAMAQEMADLISHRYDLRLALECLDAINHLQTEMRSVRDGLWRTAISHTVKCFRYNKARHQIDCGEVLLGQPDGLEVFDYFVALRN